MKLPEVWATPPCVTVPLLKQKLGSYFNTCILLTYTWLHLIPMTTLESIHYYNPMQVRDEETEAQRGNRTCSRLLREDLTEIGFQLRSSDSKVVLVPWCYTQLRASFPAELRVFLVVNLLKQTKQRFLGAGSQEWFCCTPCLSLRGRHQLWSFHPLIRSTNTFSTLELMYLPFLTCLGLSSQPNPERHKANHIKALLKIHWWFPLVYGLIKSKLPSLAFKILCDLVWFLWGSPSDFCHNVTLSLQRTIC